MELLLFRQIVVVAASLAGSYTDLKTGYIYDWVTYPLIVFGVLANFLEQEFAGMTLGIAVFVAGYALYYTGKLGGGDVKLYTGIALALPFFNGGFFVLGVIMLSALAALVFISAYYLSKYFRMGIDIEYNKAGIARALLFSLAVAAYLYFLSSAGFVSREFLIALALPLSLGILFLAFERGIRREFFLKKIKLRELEEDEIVAFDFMGEEERKKFRKGLKAIIGAREAEELGKRGVKEILVYRDLPRFGVFIFVGVALALAFPETSLFFGGWFA